MYTVFIRFLNAIDAQVHLAMPMHASTTHKLLGHWTLIQ